MRNQSCFGEKASTAKLTNQFYDILFSDRTGRTNSSLAVIDIHDNT